jgi:hypothetical protein
MIDAHLLGRCNNTLDAMLVLLLAGGRMTHTYYVSDEQVSVYLLRIAWMFIILQCSFNTSSSHFK